MRKFSPLNKLKDGQIIESTGEAWGQTSRFTPSECFSLAAGLCHPQWGCNCPAAGPCPHAKLCGVSGILYTRACLNCCTLFFLPTLYCKGFCGEQRLNSIQTNVPGVFDRPPAEPEAVLLKEIGLPQPHFAHKKLNTGISRNWQTVDQDQLTKIGGGNFYIFICNLFIYLLD